jgi:hypothetical protein
MDAIVYTKEYPVTLGLKNYRNITTKNVKKPTTSLACLLGEHATTFIQNSERSMGNLHNKQNLTFQSVRNDIRGLVTLTI